MKVKATTMVFYNDRRYREGQVFHLKDAKHFAKSSMEKLEAGQAPAPKKTTKKKTTKKVQKVEDAGPSVDQNQSVI